MVFPIAGGNESKGYEISNSLRFNNDDSPKLTFTPSSAGNRRTFTLSVWFKLSVYSTGERVLLAADDGTGGNNNFDYIAINAADKLFLYNYEGSEGYNLTSTQLFRDNAAWYHLVVAFDTTDGTASNRIKVYLNGNQITDFDTANYPSQNFQTRFNNNNAQRISSYPDQDTSYFDGYMCEYHLVDGSQLAPTSFGEFDDNGVWIPKKYTGSYGTNGFFLEFQQTGTSANSSGIGADTSGNDHHWAVTNLASTDITEDTCTNNFCTMNPIYSYTGITFSEGNLQTNLGGSNHRWGTGTFFVESGKWYFECKVLSDNNLNSGPGVIAYGIDDPLTTEGGGAGSKAEGWIYLSTSNGQLQHGNSTYGTASAATTNDILMVAFDVDNGKIWIGKNGTWSEGSNPSTGNGAVREDLGDASSGLFTPAISGYNENFQFNFGNPPFSISSGNTDGKYGNFEYAPPSGYYALCTKRLAEFG